MKNYKTLITLFAGLLILSSCEDNLNLAPISEIGSNAFYTNTEQVEAGVIAIYDGMQNMVQYEFALTEMRSDNTRTRSSEGEWAQFESMNVNPTNSTVSAYWSNNYNVIFRANTVLEHLDVVTNAAKKSQFEGEAKFARAWCHFNLVRAFGDVPLINQVVGLSDNAFFARTPKGEVYASIISDLKNAATMLPARAAIGEGRATKGAANALLGKVYLTTGDYVSAKIALDAVGSTEYTLMATYKDVFYKELNSEIIFAVQYIKDDAKDSQGFSLEFTRLGRASLNYPTNDLIGAVDTAVDKRKSTLFYWEPLVGTSGRFECGKFRSNSTNTSLGGNDWIVLRYADVLLMRVEAIMAGAESTSDATAVSAFNSIRSRAGLSTVTSVSKDALVKERRVELAFENHRLYDLVRFGVADQVMGAFSTKGEPTFTYTSDALLLPIPQREMDLYDELKQNPGYN